MPNEPLHSAGPMLMLSAHYLLSGEPYHPLGIVEEGAEPSVCLGVRFGTPNEIGKLVPRLLNQVRRNYPEFFAEMKPKDIRKVVGLLVYSTKPDKRGYPTWVGYGSDYTH